MSIPRTRFQPRLATIPRIRRLGTRVLRLPVLLLPMLGSGGCETASSTGSARYEVQAPPPPRPIALVGRERVTIAEIEPQLLEAVGGRIVRERVLEDVKATGDPMLAVMEGVDDAWEVCLLKFAMDMIGKSADINVFDFKRKGLL